MTDASPTNASPSQDGPGATALRALPAAAATPERVAVVADTGESLTYRELASRASRLAAVLRGLGLVAGDVVGVVSGNTPAYFEIAWACRLAELYYVPLNIHLGRDEAAFILGDAGVSAVVASAGAALTERLTPDIAPGVRHWLVRDGARAGWTDLDTQLASAPFFDVETEYEGSLLQYSSGTTGRPKGVKYALRKAPATPAEDPATFLPKLIGATSESIYLSPAPLYHTAPQIWSLALQRMGATIVLMTKFDAEAALELVQRHHVTHGQFVPTMFIRMLKLPDEQRLSYDVSSLQGVIHAAAPCPVQIKRQMIDWWGPIVSEFWSSSEGAGFTFITATDWLAHPGSVGKPMLGALHICDELGTELPVGEPGIVWAEGSRFSYHNDPDKDAETTSREGWRSVGDIGRMDADGYLYLTDRASFMIISGGVNIYPQESENVLIEHPRVYDAGVVGVPDDDLGEVAVAVVRPVDPESAGDELAAELAAWCESQLARYKCPRRYYFVTELPRADTGKLFKRKLRDDLLAQLSTGA